MNTRWIALLASGILIVGGWGCTGETPSEKPGPPNLILMSIDALRADHLSSHGYHRATTPFLDSLAAEGTRFSHATVNTHGTPPSHTTMLSSLYQETHRVGLNPLEYGDEAPLIPVEVELLPEILGHEGWTTVGVTGGGWMSDAYGFSRGFEHFADGGRTIDDVAAVFLEKLRTAHTTDRPFFAFLHTYQVHSPYLPPDGYGEIFGHYAGRIRPTSDALRPIASTAGRHLSESDFDYLISQYDGEIRYLDDQLRILFNRLRAEGYLDNTLVLITADHGEEFGDHGGVLHRGSLFDELVRVPFILWGSGVPEGVTDPGLVSTIDITTTLLAAAGIDIPSVMEGRDVLAPDTTPWADQRAFAQYGSTLYSVRTPRHKLIRNRKGRLLLFDLASDPRERRNLAAARTELAAELEGELDEWLRTRPKLADGAKASTEVDPATEEQLRTLGYLE